MTAQLFARRLQLRIVKPAGLADAPGGWNNQTRGCRSQRRGQVAPDPRLAVLHPLGQRHRPHRRRARVVGRGDPSRPSVFG